MKFIGLLILVFTLLVVAGQPDEILISKNSTNDTGGVGNQDMKIEDQINASSDLPSLENEPDNIDFHIMNLRKKDIPDAFIIINDSAGNEIVKKTDAMGMASARVSTGQANIVIQADKYESLKTNLNITENANYNFVLNDTISSGIILLNSILIIFPVFVMLLVIRFKKIKRWFLPPFSWVISFIIFLIISFYTNTFNIYFLNPELVLPLFVPIVAFIGATSYVTVSYLKKNEEKVATEEDWERIYFSYGRRLFIAPYIAMIALFTITDVIQAKTPWAIVFFAYFVGVYTKAIEGTLKEIGKKFLTKKQNDDIAKREMESSEIVKNLDASTNIAKKLDGVGISEICDLKAVPEDKIKEIAQKIEMDESYLRSLKEEAENLDQGIQVADKTEG